MAARKETEPPIGYLVSPRSRRTIERTAEDVRRSLDVDPLLPLPGWKLFENIGRYKVRVSGRPISLTYGVEDSLPGDALACATYSDSDSTIAVLLSSDSYADLERNGGRALLGVS